MRSHGYAQRPFGAPLRAGVVVTVLATLVVFDTVPVSAEQWLDDPVQIATLSNRADLISGGDALLEVMLPERADASQVTVAVDGRDVTSAFAVRGDGRLIGLVDGLTVGVNRVTATLPDDSGAHLDITNHPIGGPVFSGPLIQPWTCHGPAEDEDCNQPATVEWFYLPANRVPEAPCLAPLVECGTSFQPYDPENPPSDVAETTNDEGVTVPFIVRQETGVLLRDEYRFAVLHEPGASFEPWAPPPAFNRKLVITHGGGCDTSYVMGTAPGVLLEESLSRGFAVMSHALDNNGHSCNPVVQAEALLMTKELVIERLGPVRYTIGTGGSGGSMAQFHVASSYPGIYQGVTTWTMYPDTWTENIQLADYDILFEYFTNPARWDLGTVWAPHQMQAVFGHPSITNPITLNTVIPRYFDPSRTCPTTANTGPVQEVEDALGGTISCDGAEAGVHRGVADSGVEDGQACPGVPNENLYHPETNPEGLRCTLQDYQVNLLGRDPETGFARSPRDYAGVQYALNQLLDGTITPAQFVDLNSNVGSRDIDWQWQPSRQEGDPVALERLYRSGMVNQANNLDEVAIIDLRGADYGFFHDVFHSTELRERLVRANGTADNFVLWRGPLFLASDLALIDEAMIVEMDRWLAAVEADERDVPLPRKIIESRPDDLGDRCTDGTGNDMPAEFCDATVPEFSMPRVEAGMPITHDVWSCQRTPLREFDYGSVTFTEQQLGRLEEAFPDGVCDYSQPGIGMQPNEGWLTYAAGPGGRPLGDAPVSVPFGPEAVPTPPSIPTELPATGSGVGMAILLILLALYFRLGARAGRLTRDEPAQGLQRPPLT